MSTHLHTPLQRTRAFFDALGRGYTAMVEGPPPPIPSTGFPMLDSWLRQATRDLCYEARDRVIREVADHFEIAVASRTTHGMLEATAQQQALQQMGTAGAARRQFNNSYLLRREMYWKALLTSEKPAMKGHSRWKEMGMAFLPLVVIVSDLKFTAAHMDPSTIVGAGCMFALFAPMGLGRILYRLFGPTHLRHIFLFLANLDLMITVVAILITSQQFLRYLITQGPERGSPWALAYSVLAVTTLPALTHATFRIARKLSAPQGPAQS